MGLVFSATLEQVRLDRETYFVAVEKEGGALAAWQHALDRARLTAGRIRERIRQHQHSHRVLDAV